MTQPLLYDLFNEIRQDKQWIAPGLQEYYAFLKLIEAGYPFRSFDELAFVLEALWLKSHQQRERFRKLLETRRTALMQLAAAMEKDAAQKLENLKSSSETTRANGQTLNDADSPYQKATPIPHEQPKPTEKQQEKKTPLPSEAMEEWGETGFTIVRSGNFSVVQNFESNNGNGNPLLQVPFRFTNDYLPLSGRQLQQAWRSLKKVGEDGELPEVHLQQTIQQTAKRGYFIDFVYQKKMVNRLRLFLFIDRSESMQAMDEFGKELARTACQSDLHQNTRPWYFYELPQMDNRKGDYVLYNEAMTETPAMRNLFRGVLQRNLVVLIYSDAGALKNDWSEKRISATETFLQKLYSRAAYISWLNPTPKRRWQNTNAAAISSIVPMFEANSRTEVESAMGALMGRIAAIKQTQVYVAE